jgi:hypothetical protein
MFLLIEEFLIHDSREFMIQKNDGNILILLQLQLEPINRKDE